MPSFTDSKELIGVKIYFLNGSRNPDHAPFNGDLSSICWDLIYHTCTKFDQYRFSRPRDMVDAHQNLNGHVTWPRPLLGWFVLRG